MFKVMTLNLNGCGEKHGIWTLRRDRIVAAIREQEPDVVALQAVRYHPLEHGGRNQAEQLVEAIEDYRVVSYVPATTISDQNKEGSAILSRHEAVHLNHRLLALRPSEDMTVRLVLVASFERPGGRVHILNAHFSWVDEQNRGNLEEALPLVEEYGRRAVLVGDFNAQPDAAGIRLLHERGWVDSWQALKPDDPGFTFEADDPKIRIDYAWVSGDLKDRLRSVESFGDERRGQQRLSDHLGLVAALDL